MSNGRPSESNRVPWETALPGDHPAFILPDKAEMERLALTAIAEAQQFVGGPASKFASPEMKFLADAERRRTHHAANIAVTTGEQQVQHVRWWTEAMIDLGRLDAVKYYDGNAETVAQACLRADDEDCGCEREKVTLAKDGSFAKEGEQGAGIELDRRFAVKMQYDPYRGKVVMLYECRHCHTLNAMAEPPPRQASRELAQRQIETHTRAARAAGQKPTIQANDAVFLKQ